MFPTPIHLVFPALLASAAPSANLDLRWDAPPECPTAKAVKLHVQMLMVADEHPAPLSTVQATVQNEAGNYILQLDLGEQPRRTIAFEDCGSLTEAAALVIAVSLDPLGTARTTVPRLAVPAPDEPGREVPPSPDPPPPPARVGTTAAEPVPRRTSRLTAFVRPEVGIGGGVLPGAGPGFGGAIGLRGTRPWRVESFAAYWWPRHTGVAGDPSPQSRGARLWLAHGGVRGCAEPDFERWSFPLCGGLEIGAMAGEGEGPAIASRRNAALWLGAPLGAGVAWAPVPTFALLARAELVVAVRRPGFHLEGIGSVHRAGRVAGRGFVGVELRFR